MLTGPALMTFGPEASNSLTIIAVGTGLLSLLVLARLSGLVDHLARDVARRRALEAQLSFQAFHDPLTGLANRRRFVETTAATLAQRSGSGAIAALFIDLDDFKTVNDSLGHAAGDELLTGVGERVRASIRSTDLAARLGGDEFGVLLVGLPEERRATDVAERLLSALSVPMLISGVSVDVGASIGVAFDTDEMQTVDDLLSDADIAMYRAKAQGKGRYHVYRGTDPAEQAARQAWLERGPSVRHREPVPPPGREHAALGGIRLEPNAG
jgi:diguanylate cyclase (GGDEF)-like protein